MTHEGYERDVRHYEFDITGLNMNYGTGDVLGIWAHNKEEEVRTFLKSINLDANTILKLKRTDGASMDLPESMSLIQLFTEALDIFGRPSRRFYEFLAKCATDDSEKERIKFLLSK